MPISFDKTQSDKIFNNVIINFVHLIRLNLNNIRKYFFYFIKIQITVFISKVMSDSLKFLYCNYYFYHQIEAADVGRLQKVRIGHDGAGMFSGWFLEKVTHFSDYKLMMRT